MTTISRGPLESSPRLSRVVDGHCAANVSLSRVGCTYLAYTRVDGPRCRSYSFKAVAGGRVMCNNGHANPLQSTNTCGSMPVGIHSKQLTS